MLISVKGNNKKSLEHLKENLSSMDDKLLPLEEEFRHKSFTKKIISTFNSKAFNVNLTNGIILVLILIFMFLNIKSLVEKRVVSFRSNNYDSPIESILPEENYKERIYFN
jgi:hypothetical protein